MNIEEIRKETFSIKETSDKLARMVGAANSSIAAQSAAIASLVQGSCSGQEAVMSLSAAVRSLANAANEMRQLSRICDECIQNLGK